ncbi:MAG: hypothetical protein ABEN55_00070 [Bradymonadaceae bacterium]
MHLHIHLHDDETNDDQSTGMYDPGDETTDGCTVVPNNELQKTEKARREAQERLDELRKVLQDVRRVCEDNFEADFTSIRTMQVPQLLNRHINSVQEYSAERDERAGELKRQRDALRDAFDDIRGILEEELDIDTRGEGYDAVVREIGDRVASLKARAEHDAEAASELLEQRGEYQNRLVEAERERDELADKVDDLSERLSDAQAQRNEALDIGRRREERVEELEERIEEVKAERDEAVAQLADDELECDGMEFDTPAAAGDDVDQADEADAPEAPFPDDVHAWQSAEDLAERLGLTEHGVTCIAGRYENGSPVSRPIERKQRYDGHTVYRIEPDDDANDGSADDTVWVVGDEVPEGFTPQKVKSSLDAARDFAGIRATDDYEPPIVKCDGVPPELHEPVAWANIESDDRMEIIQ